MSGAGGSVGHTNLIGAGHIYGYDATWVDDTKRTLELELEERGLRFPQWWGDMLKEWRKRND
jgi:hypothetical protein